MRNSNIYIYILIIFKIKKNLNYQIYFNYFNIFSCKSQVFFSKIDYLLLK